MEQENKCPISLSNQMASVHYGAILCRSMACLKMLSLRHLHKIYVHLSVYRTGVNILLVPRKDQTNLFHYFPKELEEQRN